MAIKSGTPVIKRRHSKNYISAQADARLREVTAPYQQQGLRALEVDSFAVKYYHQCRSTTVCTCKETKLTSAFSALGTNLPPTVVKQDSVLGSSVSIDFRRQLFGTQSDSTQSDDSEGLNDDMEIVDEDDDEDAAPSVSSSFTSSADCAICYKTGYVPGYGAYGFLRKVFTTHSILDVRGYTTDQTCAPHVLKRVDPRAGYVQYELEIPKYFQDVLVSVRNNREVLGETLFNASGVPLTFTEVKNAAGTTIVIQIQAQEFTHVVVEFDLGTEKTLANLAQQQKTIDWTLFSTLGNIQIVLPMTIQTVSASDVIYVPSRKMLFKITDVTYLTTARDVNLDWSVSTRVLQPQEALGRIHRSFRLA